MFINYGLTLSVSIVSILLGILIPYRNKSILNSISKLLISLGLLGTAIAAYQYILFGH